MNASASQKTESPLYIFNGAETPSDYKAELEIPKEDEIAESKADKSGFWARQFLRESTKAQRKFDWIFGVIMPVICIFFDPAFFSSRHGHPMFGAVQPFTYVLSFTGILAMMAWLIWGKRLKWFNAILGGLFLVCGIVAFTIGFFMLPYSLFGLIIMIGALGFTPFFTSVIYLRNGIRAIGAAESFLVRKILIYTILLSALASAVIPYVINFEINQRFGCAARLTRQFCP